MNKIEKFEKFLESLKNESNSSLVESVKSGFKACHEGDILEWRERDYEECAECGRQVPRRNAVPSSDNYYCPDCEEEAPLFDRIAYKYGFDKCGLDANFSCEAVHLAGEPYADGSIYLLDDEEQETATAIRLKVDEKAGEQNIEEIKTFMEPEEFDSYYEELTGAQDG